MKRILASNSARQALRLVLSPLLSPLSTPSDPSTSPTPDKHSPRLDPTIAKETESHRAPTIDRPRLFPAALSRCRDRPIAGSRSRGIVDRAASTRSGFQASLNMEQHGELC